MPAVPAATGPYLFAFDKLASTLAASSSFQARCGLTGDPTATEQCLARIYYPVLDSDEQLAALRSLMPCLLLGWGDHFELKQASGGGQNYLRPSGSIRLTWADESRYGPNLQAGQRDFANWIGLTLVDLMAIAGVSDNLSMIGARQSMPPGGSTREDQTSNNNTPYFLASFFVDWN